MLDGSFFICFSSFTNTCLPLSFVNQEYSNKAVAAGFSSKNSLVLVDSSTSFRLIELKTPFLNKNSSGLHSQPIFRNK